MPDTPESPLDAPDVLEAARRMKAKLTPEQLRYLTGVALGIGFGLFVGLRLAKHLGGAHLAQESLNPPPPVFVRSPCAECEQRAERAHAANVAAEADWRAASPAPDVEVWPAPGTIRGDGVVVPRSPWDGVDLTPEDLLEIDRRVKETVAANGSATSVSGISDPPPILDVPE